MKQMAIDPQGVGRVLVRATNWIGDAVMTTPALRAVRHNFTAAEITLLAKPSVAPVFDGSPYVDRVLIYDSSGSHSSLTGKLRLSKLLKENSFDVAVLFQNAFEAALLSWLARIPIRLGFNTDGRGALLTHPVALKPRHKQLHEIDYYCSILEAAGLGLHGRDMTLSISDEARASARSILASNKLDTGAPLVGICPGATYGSAKRWHPERFAQVADRICETFGAHILVMGGPGEEVVGSEVARAMKYPCLNLCGQTNLRDAISIIECLDFFVTNDSGLMHVAAALGISLVAVFGSTNPITTGPCSEQSSIVRVPAPCSPCLKKRCPRDHVCMNAVSPDMVFDAVNKMFRSRAKSHSQLVLSRVNKVKTI